MIIAGTALYLLLGVAPAWPKDGGDGGDDGGGDDGGGSDSDRGDDDRGGRSGERNRGDDRSEQDGDKRRTTRREPKNEADRIREAVEQGDAEPLSEILAEVRQHFRGKVVRIRLNGRGARMHYRIRILAADSRLIEVRVNAVTGRIFDVDGL